MLHAPRRWVWGCIALAVMLACCAVPARAAEAPTVRALLVACTDFVSMPSLAPATSNNVNSLARTLTHYGDSLAALYTEIGTVADEEDLAAAIAKAFAAAGPNDLCLFYISTHGKYRPDMPEQPGVLTLSDGRRESELTGEQLQRLLDAVPGIKLVLIDACNSGALLGKGILPNFNERPALPFHAGAYYVLTSAGGNELSWNWGGEDADGTLAQGSSYFATALVHGLGLHGHYGADDDKDGSITLQEIYRYLLDNHGSSTVQVYPQQADPILFQYATMPEANGTARQTLSGITVESDALSAEEPVINFSFTVHRRTRLQYQLVYYRNGAWDWQHAQRFLDTYEPETGSDVSDGSMGVGRKNRAIDASGIDAESSGYVLLQIITLHDTYPEVYFSKVLPVLPLYGDPGLRLDTFGETFAFAPGKELTIQAVHAFPVRVSLAVYDAEGALVRRLADGQVSRPLQLQPEGSLFYWNGQDADGWPVLPGTYTLRASASVGGVRHRAELTIDIVQP